MLNAILNRAAGTSDLEATAAAAFLAGVDGATLVGALNTLNGTSGLGLDSVSNALAGTSGLSAVAALQVWAESYASMNGGSPESALNGLLDGGSPESSGAGAFDGGAP